MGVCIATLIRPWGLSGGWWASGGAAIAVLAGLISVPTAIMGASGVGGVLLFFGGLIMLTVALGEAGVMEFLMNLTNRWSGTSSLRLLVVSLVLTTLATILFSNDAAALLIAPTIARQVMQRKLPLATFLIGIAVMTNVASLVLPVSNPVNLLVLERNHIPLSTYLFTITPVALLVTLLSGLLLIWMLARRLPPKFTPAPPLSLPPQTHKLIVLGMLLGILLVADAIMSIAGLSLGPPTFIGGLVALIIGWRQGGICPLKAIQAGRWSLIFLVAGLAILTAGLQLNPHAVAVLHGLSGSRGIRAQVRTGLATAGVSAVLNNLPATFLGLAGLGAIGQLRRLGMPLIIGSDLGANLSPIGSLSTLIILTPDAGMSPMSPKGFWLVGWVVGVISLVATILVVAL